MTVACIHANFAAYDDFSGASWQAPEQFTHLQSVSGWASGKEERFGLIFQSTSDPSVWLVAFRGTASIQDGLQNLMLSRTNFLPFQSREEFPADAAVAAGFNDIYANKARSMSDSMQSQLFAALDRSKPEKLYITGHSLGGALASLFALDVATSRPGIEVVSITLASPRVGDNRWQEVYDRQFQLERATFRVANHWDPVPALPFVELGYAHVGTAVLLSFFEEEKFPEPPNVVERHSLKNYRHVLSRAVLNDPQTWHGEFVSEQGRKITSDTNVMPDIRTLVLPPPLRGSGS